MRKIFPLLPVSSDRTGGASLQASGIEELFAIHSLNYEVLSGDKEGVSSVRINRHYRLEFMVSVDETKEPVVTVCTITEISNHYK